LKVRFTLGSGGQADMPEPTLSADTVAKVVEATTGARIESDLLVQRIEVAILNSAANQCYAVESAKYFYNSIWHKADAPGVREEGPLPDPKPTLNVLRDWPALRPIRGRA